MPPDLVASAGRGGFGAGTGRTLLGAVIDIVAIAFASPLAPFAIDGPVAASFALTSAAVPELVARSSTVEISASLAGAARAVGSTPRRDRFVPGVAMAATPLHCFHRRLVPGEAPLTWSP